MQKGVAFLVVLAFIQAATSLSIPDGDLKKDALKLLSLPIGRIGSEPGVRSLLDASSGSFVDPSASGVLTDQIDRIRHAVVQLIAQQETFNWLTPWLKGTSDGLVTGTGFFVDFQGTRFIITNGHVVKQASVVVMRIPALGEETIPLKVYAVCHDKDIALLTVDHEKGTEVLNHLLEQRKTKIETLKLGNSDHFRQGSVTIAVGYPLGQANLKFSTGILSGREHVDNRFYMQTTSPINPGNSGGPLLSSNGEVMGINTAAIEKASNVGYAIPIGHIIELLKSWAPDPKRNMTGLDENSVVQKFPVMGVDLNTASSVQGAFLGYSGSGGVFVKRVYPYGFFDEAGVKQHDLLLSFDGFELDRFGFSTRAREHGTGEIMNIYDLAERIPIGKEVEMKVWRDKRVMTVKAPFNPPSKKYAVRLYEEPGKQGAGTGVGEFEVFGGLVVQPLTLNHVVALHQANTELIAYVQESNWKLREQPRLIISAVLESGSSAGDRGVAAGGIVTKVNGKPVSTLEDFRKAWLPANFKKFIKSQAKKEKSTEKLFWTLETRDGSLLVVDFIEALNNEVILSQLYHYPVSKSVKKAVIIAIQSMMASAADAVEAATATQAPRHKLRQHKRGKALEPDTKEQEEHKEEHSKQL